MKTPVVLVPGDGIGPSISSAVVRILDAAGAEDHRGSHVHVLEAVLALEDDRAGNDFPGIPENSARHGR